MHCLGGGGSSTNVIINKIDTSAEHNTGHLGPF